MSTWWFKCYKCFTIRKISDNSKLELAEKKWNSSGKLCNIICEYELFSNLYITKFYVQFVTQQIQPCQCNAILDTSFIKMFGFQIMYAKNILAIQIKFCNLTSHIY